MIARALISSNSTEWYTPIEVIAAAKRTFSSGAIDLDPASSVAANERVGARAIYTRETDGLSSPWAPWQSVLINPPGGFGQAKLWWEKLMAYRASNTLNEAIFVCFQLAHLQTLQRASVPVTDFVVCVPKRRLKYWAPGRPDSVPPHPSAVVYVPGVYDSTAYFRRHFGELGAILAPMGVHK